MTGAIVITGAAGFVGRELVRRLAPDHRVVAVVRTPPSAPLGAHETIITDLTDAFPDRPDLRGATVVHSAAVMGSGDHDVLYRANVTATFRVVEWARRHAAAQLVFISTGGVYPYGPQRHREVDPVAPIGFYGHTKWIGEQLVRTLHDLDGIPTTSVRLFFPYGPGQTRGILPFIRGAVRDGRRLVIKKDGAPGMNPVHISDVGRALEAMIATPAGSRTYNLAGDERITFLEAVRCFETIDGRTAELEWSDDVQGDLLGDNQLLRKDLGWTPEFRLSGLGDAVTLTGSV